MSRRATGAALLAASIAIGVASPGRAASRYSLRGEGEPVLPFTSAVRAMGGAEAASASPGLATNPATLALAPSTRFHGSWLTDWVRTEETLPAGVAVRKEYEGYVPNLGLVFLAPGRVRVGTGLLVDRRIDGRIVQDAETPDGRPYRQVFEASGNLLRIPLLVARDFGPVQLGAGMDFVLANSEIRWRNDFPDGTSFLDSNDRDETGAWGPAWRAGARLPLGDRAAVGAWGLWPRDLSGSRRLENEDPQDTTSASKLDFEAETAARVGAGIEASPAAGWRVAADWTHESWEDVDSPRAVGTFTDVDRVSAGVEWTGGSGSGLRQPVRAGFRTEPLHTLDANGREIRETALSAGTGFVFADGRGQFDWFLEYGWRGKKDESEYHEQFVRLGVTLTGFEEWSGRRPPEPEDEDW